MLNGKVGGSGRFDFSLRPAPVRIGFYLLAVRSFAPFQQGMRNGEQSFHGFVEAMECLGAFVALW